LSNRAGTGGGHQDSGGQGDNAHYQFNGGGSSYHEGSTSNEGFKPKTVRLEFSKFKGEDPKTWCCKAEQFFDHYSTPDAQLLFISSFHMEGRAMVWFQELKASKCVGNWEQFVTNSSLFWVFKGI